MALIKTFDARCYELAAMFLSDTLDLNHEKARHSLALEIQQTIEDEIDFMREGIFNANGARMTHVVKSTEGACEKCGCELKGEAAYIDATDEVWCHSCADNAADAAWERHCEGFHDGGDIIFKTLQQQQIEARRLK